MELVRFSALERHYGANEVFSGLDGVIRDGDKVGLVGPNGAGKSSLVRLLAGHDESDGGTIVRARARSLGYLAQDAAESGPQTLRAAFDEAMARGHAQEWEMRATLNRFDFEESDLDRPLREFSGGQRTRALLARTLLEQPDWLVLDEPTNHLDLDTVRWLENFVARDPRAFLIVSHDRYFLETVATEIWELDRGELSVYDVKPGRAYSMYVEERDIRREQQRREYEAAMTERQRQRAVIDELRTHGSHNYSAVWSREKAFARVDVVDAPRKERRKIAVALSAARRATSGPAVEIKGIAKAYDRTLFANVTATFTRGERVAIVGPNGAGKTTLLRILAGETEKHGGELAFQKGTRVALHDQRPPLEQAMSLREYVLSGARDLVATEEELARLEQAMAGGAHDQATLNRYSEAQARLEHAGGYGWRDHAASVLRGLGFAEEDLDRPLRTFSGGELTRASLARALGGDPDLLLLDEPTNHLDVANLEWLERELNSLDAAVILVAHDRWFLEAVTTATLEVEA
ncbi:MAG TPA: ABC-F family ATP-binding cassette domain-containing protein, partial [Candidatus Elarobacter sp.]|nr:ABC-F family ATP-binding cassette domain-containing protein [Candidatus Elarobacter sp.]